MRSIKNIWLDYAYQHPYLSISTRRKFNKAEVL